MQAGDMSKGCILCRATPDWLRIGPDKLLNHAGGHACLQHPAFMLRMEQASC